MPTQPAKLIDLALELRYQTALAFLVHDGHQDVWLPKSQVDLHEEGKSCVFVMPEWLAKAKGLI